MSEDSRRALVDSLIEKYQRVGAKFEDDPGFRASVDEWMTGEINIDVLRARYRALLTMRRAAKSLG
jgi:hypothetical protein